MEPMLAVITHEAAGAFASLPRRQRLTSAIVETGTSCSDHLFYRLHIDVEGFQKLRGHDVEAHRKLQLDERGRGQFRGYRVERRIGRATKADDLIGKGERSPLHFVEAARRLPLVERCVLLVGAAAFPAVP